MHSLNTNAAFDSTKENLAKIDDNKNDENQGTAEEQPEPYSRQMKQNQKQNVQRDVEADHKQLETDKVA